MTAPVTHIRVQVLPVVEGFHYSTLLDDFQIDSQGKIAVLYWSHFIYKDICVNNYNLKLNKIFFDCNDIVYGHRDIREGNVYRREFLRLDHNLSFSIVASHDLGQGLCHVNTKAACYTFDECLEYVRVLSLDTLQTNQVPLPCLHELRLKLVKTVVHEDGFWLFCTLDVSRTYPDVTITVDSIEYRHNFIVHLTPQLRLIKVVSLTESLDVSNLWDLVVVGDKLHYQRSNIKGGKVYDVHGYYYGLQMLPFSPHKKILRYYGGHLYVADEGRNRSGLKSASVDIYKCSTSKHDIATLFCLMMMVSDHELDPKYHELRKTLPTRHTYGYRALVRLTDPNLGINKMRRFFYITGGLPLELKMIIANRCYSSLREDISHKDWTTALRQLDSQSQ